MIPGTSREKRPASDLLRLLLHGDLVIGIKDVMPVVFLECLLYRLRNAIEDIKRPLRIFRFNTDWVCALCFRPTNADEKRLEFRFNAQSL